MRCRATDRVWVFAALVALPFCLATAIHIVTAAENCSSMTDACQYPSSSTCVNSGCREASFYSSPADSPCSSWTGTPPKPTYNFVWPTAIVGGPWPRCTQNRYSTGACVESLQTCMTMQEYITTAIDQNGVVTCAMLCGSYSEYRCKAGIGAQPCQ